MVPKLHSFFESVKYLIFITNKYCCDPHRKNMIIFFLTFSLGLLFLLYITRRLPLMDRIKIIISALFYTILCGFARNLGLFLGNHKEKN